MLTPWCTGVRQGDPEGDDDGRYQDVHDLLANPSGPCEAHWPVLLRIFLLHLGEKRDFGKYLLHLGEKGDFGKYLLHLGEKRDFGKIFASSIEEDATLVSI